MTDLAKLIERVEAATDFDRELDRDIGFALDGWERSGDADNLIYVPAEATYYADHPGSMYPSFTESVDDALGLVERMLPGWGHQVGRPIQTYVNGYYASVFAEGQYFHDWMGTDDKIRPRDSYRPSGAIAILLALLRAIDGKR